VFKNRYFEGFLNFVMIWQTLTGAQQESLLAALIGEQICICCPAGGGS